MNKKGDYFLVEGLSGKKTLRGTISVSGSKNAALPLLASSLLFEAPVSFTNVPEIEDIRGILELLEHLGVKISRRPHEVDIDTRNVSGRVLSEKIAKRMRGSIVLSGPLLARMGSVSFPHPGGCVIGERPIDLFLEGFKKMGAQVSLENEIYTITASQGLSGTEIFFPIASVTGTETFLMAATVAQGTTVLKNAALEPEVSHLAEFLISSGARISGAGTPTITIEGNGKLSRKTPFAVMPDRIETGSMLLLGALCADTLEITNCNPKDIESLINALSRCGLSLEIGETTITLRDNASVDTRSLRGTNIRTHEYPGFPTDLQAPMMVFLTQVSGESLIFETIFEGRLNYCEDLNRMGANIRVWDAHRATVRGGSQLKGRKLESPDLRAGLAFLIAALVAGGESVIHNIHYIDRGYEAIEKRLSALGASLRRVSGV